MKKIGKTIGGLAIWASAYVNVIAFALCGGYMWLKSDDEDLKRETKKALIVTLIFVGIGMIQSLTGYIFNLCDISYGNGIYSAHQTIGTLVSIAKIVAYATGAALAVFGGKNGDAENEKTESDGDKEADENDGNKE